MIKWFSCILLWGVLPSCRHEDKKSLHDYDVISHKDNDIPNKEASAYFEKGLQYVEKEDYANAKNAFIKADDACPNTPVILNAIGNTIIHTDIPENGAPYYERAKHIFYLGLARPSTYKTDRRALFLNLAYSYCLEKEYNQALIFLDSAKSGANHDQIYNAAEEADKLIRTNIH